MAFCRCRTCGHRRTLPTMRPETLDLSLRRNQCQPCVRARRFKGWRVDRYRHKHERGRGAPNCNCGAYPFQHREGSGWCFLNPNTTEADWASRTRY